MPIATLKFTLPEEEQEFNNAISAYKLKSVLWDFSNQLRSWQKYHHDFKDADDALDNIREEFYRCLNEHNVLLD
jgi:hypothetical protein